jgi:hypothetical protein
LTAAHGAKAGVPVPAATHEKRPEPGDLLMNLL